MRLVATVTAVTAVQEEVHADADHQGQQEGERTEYVRPMLQPQEESRDREKDAHGQDGGAAPTASLPIRNFAHLDAPGRQLRMDGTIGDDAS
jgi:hypothetical protein